MGFNIPSLLLSDSEKCSTWNNLIAIMEFLYYFHTHPSGAFVENSGGGK